MTETENICHELRKYASIKTNLRSDVNFMQKESKTVDKHRGDGRGN